MLGQRKVGEKFNEMTAIPKLLEAQELAGTVVTIDAIGLQCLIAEKIVAKKADYILAVKENQGGLPEGIRDSFQMLPTPWPKRSTAATGRVGPAGDRRPVAGREGGGMAVVAGSGADRDQAILQGDTQGGA